MLVQNNPVSRLVAVLEKARPIAGATSLRNVWATTFGCEPSDTAELLRLVGSLIALAAEAKAAVQAVDNIDEQLYLAPFKPVENVLSNMNFERKWADVSLELSPQTMVGLKFAADLLKREGISAVEISDDRVNELISTLAEVLERAMDSELPDNLKRLFVRNLEELRRALLCLQISGPDGVEQEIDRAMGSILRYSQQLKDIASENGENESIIRDDFALMGNINEMVSFAQNAPWLAAAVTPYLSRFLS